MNQQPTTGQAVTAIEAAGPSWRLLAPHVRMGLLASFAALAIWAIAAGIDPEMGLFWAYGLAFGFVLQRGRLCFAAAFRDVFLLQHGRTLKAVLAGLAVATIGFGLVMSKQVPNPALGFLPPSRYRWGLRLSYPDAGALALANRRDRLVTRRINHGLKPQKGQSPARVRARSRPSRCGRAALLARNCACCGSGPTWTCTS